MEKHERFEKEKSQEKEWTRRIYVAEETPLTCDCSHCDGEDEKKWVPQRCTGCSTWTRGSNQCATGRITEFCSVCTRYLCRVCDRQNLMVDFEFDHQRSLEDMKKFLKRKLQKDSNYLQICLKCTPDVNKDETFVFHCKACLLSCCGLL